MEDRHVPTPACASCEQGTQKKICYTEEGLGSKGCPTLINKEVLVEANDEYGVPEIKEFARQSSIQEAECYANRDQRPYVIQPTKTRIVEICEFAQGWATDALGSRFASVWRERPASLRKSSRPADLKWSLWSARPGGPPKKR